MSSTDSTSSSTSEPQRVVKVSFEDLVDGFAQQVSQLLAETLPTLKGDIAVEKDGGKALVKLVGSAKRDRAIATTGSRDAAQLHVMLKCRMDSAGRYLAVSKSTYALYAVKDDEPLFRLEYIDDMRNKPACHCWPYPSGPVGWSI